MIAALTWCGVPVLSSPESDQPPSQHTQTALAEIFAGNPRPHYRSASFSVPQPHAPVTSSPRLDLPSATTSPRSYFSPPLPSAPLLVRARSQSSAPAPMSYGAPRAPAQHQPPADQYGFRPSSGTPFASSLPSTTSQSIRIGNAVPSSPYPDDGFSPSQSRFGGQFGSFNGGSSPSLGGGMYDPQTGWRSTTGGRPGSFGAEDAEREGRSRMRAEEQYRPWGDSEGGGSGIGASNMSPFSRDGGRTLPDLTPDGNGAASGYRARREYSLGAVGSGRKRGDTLWTSRPLREAEDEDADDAFAPPTKSGATSRRHSVSGFNPPNRSQFGFSFPDEMRMSKADTSGGGGLSSLSPNGGGGSYGSFGRGSSAIDDDDLASDFNSLQLNLEAHAAATEGTQRVFHVGSMPTNFPPSRATSHYDHEASPEIPTRDLYSPSSSRFVQAQASPAAGTRSASRFEFGGVGAGSPSHTQGEFSSAGAYAPPSGNSAIPRYPFATGAPPPPFYSTPLSAQGLSAQAPAFQAFGGPPNPSQFSPYQQMSSFAPPPVPSLAPEHTNLGRGIPLHTVPTDAPLYIVEFKAGRKDLFFVEDPKLVLRQGDLVIVEADRGQDIGKFFKPCSLDEVQAFQQRLVELALGQLANPGGGAPPNPASIARMTKEFAPKKIFGKAQPADTQMLLSKAQDEVKALALVRSKVAAKSESSSRPLLESVLMSVDRSSDGGVRCRMAVGQEEVDAVLRR